MSAETPPPATRGLLIVGGGNAAHVMCATASAAGFRVRVLTSFGDEAQRWSPEVTARDAHTGREWRGSPELVTADAAEAVGGAGVDAIVLSLPAQFHAGYLDALAPHLPRGRPVMVGATPGYAFFDLVARRHLAPGGGALPEGMTLFAIETLPWACRVAEYGARAEVLGAKEDMGVAVTPASRAAAVAALLRDACGGPHFEPMHEHGFLEQSLSALNPALHPAIFYGQFRDWDGRSTFAEAPLFYQGVDETGAAAVSSVSDEMLAVCRAIEARCPGVRLDDVRHISDALRHCYEGQIGRPDGSMRDILVTNEAYAGLTHKMKEAPGGGGLVPDLGYRYVSEDIPEGLCAVRGVAELVGVATPTVDTILRFVERLTGRRYLDAEGRLAGPDAAATRAPQAFGIDTIEKLLASVE